MTLFGIDPVCLLLAHIHSSVSICDGATYNPHGKRRHRRFYATGFIRHAVARRIKPITLGSHLTTSDMTKDSALVLRVSVSLAASTGAGLHMVFPAFIPDAITAGLILLAVVPWLSPIIKTIQVTGVGKLELRVQQVKEKQAVLEEEVDALRFLLSGFVTHWEFAHLKKLAAGGLFEYQRGSEKRWLLVAGVIAATPADRLTRPTSSSGELARLQ
jgi:hypothetical protein